MCDREVCRYKSGIREVPSLNLTLIYPHFRGVLHLRQTYTGFLFQIKLGPSPSTKYPKFYAPIILIVDIYCLKN
jgi:hypothetical protein